MIVLNESTKVEKKNIKKKEGARMKNALEKDCANRHVCPSFSNVTSFARFSVLRRFVINFFWPN